MDALSYFDAWRLWWHGNLTTDHTMWTLPIFAWARIGKGLSFLGGLTVLLDIVGERKVRNFGKQMRDFITFRRAFVGMFYSVVFAVEEYSIVKKLVYRAGRSVAGIFLGRKPDERAKRARRAREWFEWDQKREKLREIGGPAERMMPIVMGLLTLGAVWIALLMTTRYESGALAIMLLVLSLGLYVWLAILVLGSLLTIGYAFMLFLVALVVILFDFVIDRIADVLKRDDNGTVIRTIGVILFLIGFHFDLLGS